MLGATEYKKKNIMHDLYLCRIYDIEMNIWKIDILTSNCII